jgi:hypothetical protein
VKMWGKDKQPAPGVDYLIGLEVKDAHNAKGADWLLTAVKESPAVMSWMVRSLHWLPRKFLKKFGV